MNPFRAGSVGILLLASIAASGGCGQRDTSASRVLESRGVRTALIAWVDTSHLLVSRLGLSGAGDVIETTCDSAGLYRLRLDGTATPLSVTAAACSAIRGASDLVVDRSGMRLLTVPADYPATVEEFTLPNWERRTLISGCSGLSDATWSTDGANIAFVGRCLDATSASLWIARADGAEMREMDTTARGDVIGNPAWSPDGQHIAYSLADSALRVRIVVLAVQDGAERTIGAGSLPAWAPHANCIAAVSSDSASLQLRIYSLDDVRATRIIELRAAEFEFEQAGPRAILSPPRWSPDGEWLVVETDAGLAVVSLGSRDHRVLQYPWPNETHRP